MMLKVLLLLVGIAVPGLAAAETLRLQCDGAGIVEKTRGTTGYAYNNQTGQSETYNGVSRSESEAPDTVLVDITDGVGKVRFPRRFLPPLHSGDDDGWRQLSSLSMTDAEISGVASFNFLNKPRLRIDRVTGLIEASGMGMTFSGHCRPYAPSARQF